MADLAVRAPTAKGLNEAERKIQAILEWRGKSVSLAQMNSGKAALLLGSVRSRSEVTVVDCNELFVTVRYGDSSRSIPLRKVDVSLDNATDRLELQEHGS